MADCHYCGHLNGGHHETCPGERTEAWAKGYADGRNGPEPQSDDPVYRLGWNRGNIASEEAANGLQTWGH